MAGQPEVFVRPLEPAEAQRLVKITGMARDRVRLRRAGIVQASSRGRSAAEFAALDLATGQLFYRFRDRKRWPEFGDFCKQLRRRSPTGKLYLISDNYGPRQSRGHHPVSGQRRRAGVHTTNASWLNWIESEFTAPRYFTLDGSDYPDQAAQATAIAGYIRWRNKHAQPRRHFALDSKIRRPDYLPNVA
jgi:hypothetical protein